MTAIRQHDTIKLFTGILIFFLFLLYPIKSDEYVHIYKVVHSYSQIYSSFKQPGYERMYKWKFLNSGHMS